VRSPCRCMHKQQLHCNRRTVFCTQSVPRCYKQDQTGETVKDGHEVPGTRIRERLRWRGLAAYTKYKPVLSSERAPHKNKTVTVKRVINIWSWVADGAGSTPRLTDWLTVSRNVTLTLTFDWLTHWLTVGRNIRFILRLLGFSRCERFLL
jgi:hypothetical protein